MQNQPALAALFVALAATAVSPTAYGYTLVPRSTFSTELTVPSGPEGLAFGIESVQGVDTRVIYVSNEGAGAAIDVFLADATEIPDPNNPGMFIQPTSIRSFASPVADPRGLDLLPNGNLIVSSVSSTDRVVEIYRFDPDGAGSLVAGSIVPGGVSITVGPGTPYFIDQPETVTWISGLGTSHPGVPSILVGSEDTSTLFDLNFDGTSNGSFPTNPTLTDLSGSAFDPDTGLLFFVDDSSGGGVTFLQIVTPTGGVQTTEQIDVQLLTAGIRGCEDEFPGPPPSNLNCVDPEGLAFDPTDFVEGPTSYTGILFMGFENEQRVLSFGVVGQIPEPGSVLLLGAGLAGLAALRRQRPIS